MQISVIVTIGTDYKYVHRALTSLKKQSLHDFEVLMIRFGSAGDSSVAESFAKANRHFTLVESVQPELASARNLGLSLAKGKYVIFLDGNNVFSNHFLEEMLICAEKYAAEMTVGRMSGFDAFGEYRFSSTVDIARSKQTNGYDTALIWNPSVTNKLFLRQAVLDRKLSFKSCGAAQDAAFSLTFALGCTDIGCCQRSYARHRYLPFDRRDIERLSTMENYCTAYAGILDAARESFRITREKAETDFDRKGLLELESYYINELILKEISVLFYMFYRRFWLLNEAELNRVADVAEKLMESLTDSGRQTLLKLNKDIFFDGRLLRTKAEMASHAILTVAVSGDITPPQLSKQLEMLYVQEMPAFECLLPERFKADVSEEYASMPNLRFVEAYSEAEFKNAALDYGSGKYIVYIDHHVIISTKIFRKHYNNLEPLKNRAFSTSPVMHFDGSGAKNFKFSQLAFSVKKDARRTVQDDTYVLDLFFCNKMFSREHLLGVRFGFTGNSVVDVCKIYNCSSYSKLQLRGVYLEETEEHVINHLREQENLLPASCRSYYKHYKKTYHAKVTYSRRRKRRQALAAEAKAYLSAKYESAKLRRYSIGKLRKKVLFIASGAKNMPSTNLECVFRELKAKKLWVPLKEVRSLSARLKLYRWLMQSRVVITDGPVPFLRTIKLRESQKLIQIWHSSGALKRFGMDAVPEDSTKIDEWRTHRQYSLVAVSSEHVRQFYAHAFGAELDTVKALGTPQTDLLASETSRREMRDAMLAKHPCLRNSKVYLYCPTFRESGGEIVKFNPKLKWGKLDAELADDEIFVIDTHPLMTENYLGGNFPEHVKDYSYEPTPELMAVADVVITDYSSVVLDGALLSLPMVFYCPDYDTYPRDFYVDYPDDLPGPVVTDPNELLGTIRSVLASPPRDKIEKFRTAQVGACDGESTGRIVEVINDYLNSEE